MPPPGDLPYSQGSSSVLMFPPRSCLAPLTLSSPKARGSILKSISHPVTVTHPLVIPHAFPRWLSGKESTSKARNQIQSLRWEDSLEKEMAIHSSILAWRIPWTAEPSGL